MKKFSKKFFSLKKFIKKPKVIKRGGAMLQESGLLSVKEVTDLCLMDRNRVGYLIRSGKLAATRRGKKYYVHIEELHLFLRSAGLKVSSELLKKAEMRPRFEKIQRCWEYWKGNHETKKCHQCSTFKNQISVCFFLKGSATPCGERCFECEYYQSIFGTRIRFIHQIALPAAVCKDFFIWGGNRLFSELLGISPEELVGMGIDQVLYPESLEKIISFEKKKALNENSFPLSSGIFLKNKNHNKLRGKITVFPLLEPKDAFCAIFNTPRAHASSCISNIICPCHTAI